jgi:hypothetical protein
VSSLGSQDGTSCGEVGWVLDVLGGTELVMTKIMSEENCGWELVD